MVPSRLRRTILAATAAVAALAAVTLLAPPPRARAAGQNDPRLISLKNPKKKVYGLTPAEWTAHWWQWLLSMPTSISPAFDDTGERFSHGQRGPVWFMVGAFNRSDVVTRHVTMPAGKALLLPVMNGINDNVNVDPPHDIAGLRGVLSEYVSAISGLSVEIDGVSVPAGALARIASPVFQYVYPEENVGQFFEQGTPAGVYAPAVADGYWVLIRPLSVGTHTVRAVGTNGDFRLDITHEITVVDQESFPH